jgi:hypothetical protein
MWSQGMMFGIEMAAQGAAALGEIDQIGQQLKPHVGDNERWWQEWTAMAKRKQNGKTTTNDLQPGLPSHRGS